MRLVELFKPSGRRVTPAKLFYFLAIVLLGIPACSQSPDCFREDIFCAALVTDTGGLNDHGMNQDTWAGLEQSKADGIADQITYIESVDARDYEKNITFFAREGYDVIITTGIGLRDATLRAADPNPGSVFIGMGQPHEETRPNLIPVTFAEDQMGFLAGALAARISKTRIIGAVCETSGIDSMWRYCEGFRAGALYMDENIEIFIEYRDDGSREKLFVDEAWGYETAQKHVQSGADVVFAAGGGTGQGALRAASEAGIHAIGAERDQAAALGPSAGSGVVASIYGNARLEVRELMRLLKSGQINERGAGQIGYVPLDDQKFPENLPNEMDELLANLLNGSIKTNVPFEKP